MPVVESGLIGHTRRMNMSYDAETSNTGPAPVIERFRWFWQRRGPGWLALIALYSLIVARWGFAETNQAAINEDIKQIQGRRCAGFLHRPSQRRGQVGRQAPGASLIAANLSV